MARRNRHLQTNTQQPPHLTANQLVALTSDLVNRASLAARMGQSFGGDRDFYKTFGYQDNITFSQYWSWYRRGGLAKRIIDLPIEATWRHPPELSEDDTPKSDTQFETAWDGIEKRLGLSARLKRADILQSVGHYAVMLLGTRDVQPLDQPLHDGTFTKPEDLLYVQTFSENHAAIAEMEEDTRTARYGLPKYYNVSFAAQNVATASSPKSQTMRVHYSRLLHFAEGCLEDDVYGTPKLEASFNLVLDLLKVTGGSAEGFWQNCLDRLKLSIDPAATYSPADIEALADQIEDFTHKLSPAVYGKGVSMDRLGISIADPRGNYEIILDQIAGTTGIPKRLLTGSEQGELASSQDRQNWAERVMERQSQFAEPGMLRLAVDRLIALGILPTPQQDTYQVKWKNLLELDDMQKATLSLTRAQAASAYVSGSVDMILGSGEFREGMGLEAEIPEDQRLPEEPALPEGDPQVQAQFAQGKKAA